MTTRNKRISELAEAIYQAVSGADNREEYDRLTTEIAEWLDNGDGGEGATVEELVAEWQEYQQDAEDAE